MKIFGRDRMMKTISGGAKYSQKDGVGIVSDDSGVVGRRGSDCPYCGRRRCGVRSLHRRMANAWVSG